MDFKEHICHSYEDSKAKALLESLMMPRTHALIINPNKISDEEFLARFPLVTPHPYVKHAFLYDKNVYDLGKSIEHLAGAIYISDPSSLIVASILNAQKDDFVLDMCAAPGGKTIQTSFLMKNQGVIISNDLSYNRALTLSQNVERTGRKNIVVTSNDLSKLSIKYHGLFTKIILDAPCSGSGMFRKEEKMLTDWSIEKVNRQSEIQKQLLLLAYDFLAPGGKLIYSTCSYSKEENYEVIKSLLSQKDDIHLLPLTKFSGISLTNPQEGITLAPSTFQGEGQYFCLLQKDGELNSKDYAAHDKQKIYDLPILEGKIINKKEEIYLSPTKLDLKDFKIIRHGLKIGEMRKNIFIPDYHLAHFLDTTNSLVLSKENLTKYLHGETITQNSKSGFILVSYQNMNIGYVKSVNGILKNHFPKGLRI